MENMPATVPRPIRPDLEPNQINGENLHVFRQIKKFPTAQVHNTLARFDFGANIALPCH